MRKIMAECYDELVSTNGQKFKKAKTARKNQSFKMHENPRPTVTAWKIRSEFEGHLWLKRKKIYRELLAFLKILDRNSFIVFLLDKFHIPNCTQCNSLWLRHIKKLKKLN